MPPTMQQQDSDMTWKLEPHDGYMSDETPPIQIVDDAGKVVACNTTFYPTAITAEHAATIVAAVNGRAELVEALRKAQKALALIIEPNAIKQSTVINAFAQVMAAEVEARAVLEATP